MSTWASIPFAGQYNFPFYWLLSIHSSNVTGVRKLRESLIQLQITGQMYHYAWKKKGVIVTFLPHHEILFYVFRTSMRYAFRVLLNALDIQGPTICSI